MKIQFGICFISLILFLTSPEVLAQVSLKSKKDVALNPIKSKKIQEIGKSVLKARWLGRDEKGFKKDKEMLKSFRKSLRNLNRELIKVDSIDLNSIEPTPQSSNSSNGLITEKQEKITRERRKNHQNLFRGTAVKLKELQKDYQFRRIEKKISKLERKLERVNNDSLWNRLKGIGKISDLKNQLKLEESKLDKINQTGKPLPLKSDPEKPGENSELTYEVDGSSRIAAMAVELEELANETDVLVQKEKFKDLIKRSGASGGILARDIPKIRPTLKLRTHHR